MRADRSLEPPTLPLANILDGLPVVHVERTMPGYDCDDPEILLPIFTPKPETQRPRPCVHHIRGGDVVFFNRVFGAEAPLSWATHGDAVVISVEHRLAPASRGSTN
ncbi:hypothetical protein B0O99DRAFT_600719 [Bisporella sp. PMI_857]|nr:hypothetical protein B0O99DRAFT_600719 [Bisporella sp. PMI_857]